MSSGTIKDADHLAVVPCCQAELARAWFTGWVAAACEQEPALEPVLAAEDYTSRRLAQLAAGGLAVTVDHSDVLVLPGQAV